MIICESMFVGTPDQKDPRYAMPEVDIYGHVPLHYTAHRLSIRKRLADGRYELYRHYYDGRKTQVEIVIRVGTLSEVVTNANEELVSFYGLDHRKPDTVCDHSGNIGTSASNCHYEETH